MPDARMLTPRVRTYLAICRHCGLTREAETAVLQRAADIALARHSRRIGRNHLEQALDELTGKEQSHV